MNKHVERAKDFLELIVANKIMEAYNKHVHEAFIHHNPFFQGDRNSLQNAMEENAKDSPKKLIDIKLACEDRDLVSVLALIQQSNTDPGMAASYYFKFKNDKIQEMWSIHQSVPVEIINENGMF